MTRILTFCTLAPVLGLALSTGSALAQGGPPSGPWRTSADAIAAWQGKTDLDDGGSFSVNRSFLSGTVGYGWSRTGSIGLNIGAGRWDYSFSDSAELSGVTPWSDIEDFRISAPIRFGFGETGQAIVIPSVRYSAETDADLEDGQTMGVIAGAFWRVSPTLSIGPGFGWFTGLDDRDEAFPILVIDWDISDRWNLSTGQGLAASQGPGLNLSYRYSDALTLGVAGRSENVSFRLDDKGPAPDGIGEDKSYPVVATLAYSPNPGMELSAFAGVELGGTLTLRDEDGGLVDRRDYDPVPILGASVQFRF